MFNIMNIEKGVVMSKGARPAKSGLSNSCLYSIPVVSKEKRNEKIRNTGCFYDDV